MEKMVPVTLEATHLKGRRYAVSPLGQLGTCGYYPTAWTVQFINAASPEDAIRKAKPIMMKKAV